MVEVATQHAQELNAKNVQIFHSSFDDIDLEDESVDVVLSNGAINLTSCKESVFSEIYRVLKPNGKLSFADMIDISIDEDSCSLVEKLSCCDAQEDWANCVAGTMRENELIEGIKAAGFYDVKCTGHTHYSTSDTTQGATFKAIKTPSDVLRKKHWESIFKRSDHTKVLWHQSSPKKSYELIENHHQDKANIIDVGCGASLLVDNLLENEDNTITLLDTSKSSLEIVKNRISNDKVKFICGDILNFTTEKKFDIWHDRAVFHFLLSKKEREQYFKVLDNVLESTGIAIISTFKEGGPTQCAGLDIVQYNNQKILEELPSQLSLIESEEYTHVTPQGNNQEYIYFVIKKTSFL